MAIEITFLGTSDAIPTAERNHTSILIRYKNESILVDCGEGTQRQFRFAKINPCKLTKILITHWHGDHVLGLQGLLQTLALNNYNRTLTIYGPRGTKEFMSLIFRVFVFAGRLKIEVKEVGGGVFLNENGIILEAFPLVHSAPCVGYALSEADKRRMDTSKLKKFGLKGKIIGELQRGKEVMIGNRTIKPDDVSHVEKGKRIAFILDTALCNNCYKTARDADLLISEATFLSQEEKKALEYRHLTAEQAANIAKESNVKNLILTHISQRHEKEKQKLIEEAQKIFKNTKLARDFMKLEI